MSSFLWGIIPSPGSLWNTVLPRPPKPSLAQSLPSSDVIDTVERCHITNALQGHASALHQMLLTQEVIDPSDPRRLEPSTSPGEVNETWPPVPPWGIAIHWLVCQSLLLLRIWGMQILQLPNMVEVWKSNHNLKVLDWVHRWLTWMIIHKKHLNYWRWTQEISKDILQMGPLAVLAIKQEPQGLIMPMQAVVQNLQEVSVAVQGSLEASVCGGMVMDKSQLQGAPPQQSFTHDCPWIKFKPSSNFRYTQPRHTQWQVKLRGCKTQRFSLVKTEDSVK